MARKPSLEGCICGTLAPARVGGTSTEMSRQIVEQTPDPAVLLLYLIASELRVHVALTAFVLGNLDANTLRFAGFRFHCLEGLSHARHVAFTSVCPSAPKVEARGRPLRSPIMGSSQPGPQRETKRPEATEGA